MAAEPIRVAFWFTYDELIDVTMRWYLRGEAVRAHRRYCRLSAAGVAGVITVLLPISGPHGAPISRVAIALIGLSVAAVVFFLMGHFYEHGLWRWLRKDLTTRFGENPDFTTEIELRSEGFWCRQFGIEILTPWKNLTSVIEQAGDVELTFNRSPTVVRARAFEMDADRQRFIERARELAAAGGATVSSV